MDTVQTIIRAPVAQHELDELTNTLSTTKPAKPYAFILGQGLWSHLNLTDTMMWVDQIQGAVRQKAPYLADEKAFWPRLFVTPNASGDKKSDEWILKQGNKALSIFEKAVAIETAKLGIEHLGTWNMTIQSNVPDGT
jgi:hypothetical protein